VSAATIERAPVGLILPDELTFNEWKTIGEDLEGDHNALMWQRADWAAYGERRYRRDYGPALEQLYSRQGIYDLASVARRVDISRRREDLSFSHHREVASLDPELQSVWLDDALRHGWTVHELRAQIAATKAAGQRKPQGEVEPREEAARSRLDYIASEIAALVDLEDKEAAHARADLLVLEALRELGADHVADAFERGRWWR